MSSQPTQIIRHRFVADKESINDAGKLGICRILTEISAINDHALLHRFGTLDYNKISANWYSLHFTGDAFLGDEIKVEGIIHSSDGRSMEVLIFAEKETPKGTETIAEGWFFFTLKKVPKMEFSLS